MQEFEMHFSDLNEEARERFLAFAGMKDKREGNFDVLALAVIDFFIDEDN